MPSDVFDHMEEAWKLEKNPFPAEAIRIQNVAQPYSESVFPEETNEFRRKLIRGGVRGGQAIGFLWSKGQRADTGFGKTTLLQEVAREINTDFGNATLEKAGAKKAARPPIAATFSNLNNLNATGLYPVLFNAVVDLATAHDASAESVFDKARARIVEAVGSDEAEAISEHVRDTWATIGGTSGPLRSELVESFATGGSNAAQGATRRSLADRSPAQRAPISGFRSRRTVRGRNRSSVSDDRPARRSGHKSGGKFGQALS